MSGLVYPVLILNIILANIIFPLGKMIGMVQLRTSFVVSSRSRETDSPLTDGRGRMKLYHACIDHTHLKEFTSV